MKRSISVVRRTRGKCSGTKGGNANVIHRRKKMHMAAVHFTIINNYSPTLNDCFSICYNKMRYVV